MHLLAADTPGSVGYHSDGGFDQGRRPAIVPINTSNTSSGMGSPQASDTNYQPRHTRTVAAFYLYSSNACSANAHTKRCLSSPTSRHLATGSYANDEGQSIYDLAATLLKLRMAPLTTAVQQKQQYLRLHIESLVQQCRFQSVDHYERQFAGIDTLLGNRSPRRAVRPGNTRRSAWVPCSSRWQRYSVTIKWCCMLSVSCHGYL